jgi:hypothetical protein
MKTSDRLENQPLLSFLVTGFPANDETVVLDVYTFCNGSSQCGVSAIPPPPPPFGIVPSFVFDPPEDPLARFHERRCHAVVMSPTIARKIKARG